MPDDSDIERFLEKTIQDNDHIGKILRSLRVLVKETYQESTEEIKYGGICFFDAGLMVGGIFPRKKHVSFEFGEGAAMEDPDGLLEGKGTFRRHLKIRSREDIEGKKVPYYLRQAFHD